MFSLELEIFYFYMKTKLNLGVETEFSKVLVERLADWYRSSRIEVCSDQMFPMIIIEHL